jgi:hypothetical protein
MAIKRVRIVSWRIIAGIDLGNRPTRPDPIIFDPFLFFY